MNTYVLQGGRAALPRLQTLAEAKWPSTRALLQRLNICPGMQCLDVGCGDGHVTAKIAELVGPSGRVVGIDGDEEILQAAREATKHRLLPLEFQRRDVLDLAQPPIYDLVFARFLLTHVPNPLAALRNMADATKPGGWVAIEDIDFAGHVGYPPTPAFDRYQHLYVAAVQLKGGDPFIGPRLMSLMTDANLIDLEIEVILPIFHRLEPGKYIASLTMEHIRDSLLHHGLASSDEIESLVRQLTEWIENPRTLVSMSRIFQVWGRKASP